MEQTTFAKKTVVLAALGALSLMAATVRAADETETEPAPEAKTIEVTIGAGASEGTVIGSTIDSANEKVEWNDAWLNEVLKDNETFGGLTFKEAGIITVNGEGSFSIDLPTSDVQQCESRRQRRRCIQQLVPRADHEWWLPDGYQW